MENLNNTNTDFRLKKLVADGNFSVLLHACCAPCATHVLSVFAQNPSVKVTVFYFNPSIMPRAEYELRGAELERLCKETSVDFVRGEYENTEFLSRVSGLECEKEGGERCKICFTQRLQGAAEYALRQNFDYFCTTLTVSPHKNSEIINQIGQEIEKNVALRNYKKLIKYLPSDFKKCGGYQHSVEMSKQKNLHRQNYCGCRL